ncbi:unconventional myosin-XVIIIa isoform X7 [Diachasmimorpha longicaudata]|uniref:unconventional myosin-XVIIIa isoform X7 n=1 Tax=Diachasmimorpha longicaudata TaxID=58733 RepID=UPI0030B90894
MFNFMKKTTEKEEKEKRKREKKERKDVKKRERGSMSTEELLRLDEMRRSLKIRGRRKEKEKLPSGITADYSASFFAQLDRDLPDNTINPAGTSWTRTPDGLTQSDSSEASLTSLSHAVGRNLPPLPPKPPKRGILKGPRLSITSITSVVETAVTQNGSESENNHSEASTLLVRNTLQNEVIAYQNLPSHGSDVCSEEESLYRGRSPQGQESKLLLVTSASPSADSLTDTTNSSFATPPFSLSPVGESQGFSRWRSSASFEDQGIDLPLPGIIPLVMQQPRELTIQRQPPPRNDFGFSLRRAVIVERGVNGTAQMKPVTFAEPGAIVQNNNDTGLLPGDRLIEVNGINVDDKAREEIIDLIKGSGNCVTVKVQPVAELSELSRRGGSDGQQVELAPANIRGGTLRRSGSQRFHQNTIFFRAGALERLESQRDEKLTGHIILLQARCRGYLARRKLNTLKLQDLAVRCIQRNVRKLMSVREWPWWRLYVKVAPLLNVHRTEDQLKARTEELELLRAKVEKLEQERNHLKHDNDKLEAKLSVMTADYAEEHSTSTLAAERIDAETSERLRLERELQDVTEAHKNLQQTTERLEMELLYARAADLNGIVSDGEDGEDGGVYKQRYEHAIRELEFIKRKMAQQHEDDLEQLVGLKKQLEKKLGDAYEEVEEQRQVVGQWKRRVQKLNGEMHDLRLLLEEQTARNNLLEKKQRKFDSETQNLMDDLRQEKAQRERLAREKEIAIAEKFTIEQNLSDAKLEIELQEERLHTLSQELEELTFGGKTEEEVAQLKKAKHELEKKSKDQEEELDDLAGQVQLLEQAKLRLEMSIEQQRKEMRKEMQQRDEELEDVRGNAHKKVKALEAQLENEHEERTILLREKHELERRLVAFEDQDRSDRAAEAETTQRLKRDLKRTRALLRDAQTMLERSKGDSTGKAALRQLKNQLEDAECARAVAVKAKQALEQELNETQAALDEASKARSEAEERANAANRERTELVSQLEENEEELAEVLKKYRAAVQQVSSEQAQLQEAQVQMSALEAEKSALKDQMMELTQRLESVEHLGDPTANSLATRRLEFRAKELESKLELEQTTRARVETQIARMKETVDKLQTETAVLRTKEQTAQDAVRRLQRSLREVKDEASSATAREQEATRARRDLEKALDAAEAETKIARDDLRLALQRIDDLQSAIQGELDLDCSEEGTSENSDSD